MTERSDVMGFYDCCFCFVQRVQEYGLCEAERDESWELEARSGTEAKSNCLLLLADCTEMWLMLRAGDSSITCHSPSNFHFNLF